MELLSPIQHRFVEAYVAQGDVTNGKEAALAAGYSQGSADTMASRLLATLKIQNRIETRRAEIGARLGATADFCVRFWMEQAKANPTDIVQVLNAACKKCWPGLDSAGLPPDPKCPRCDGAGHVTQVVVAELKKGKRYPGLKSIHQTKDGIKIEFHDPQKAVDKIADWIGMNNNKNELTGPGGGPIQLQAVGNTRPLNEMTLEELDAELMRIEQLKRLENSSNGVDLGVGGPVLEGKLLES